MRIWVDADACPRPIKEILYKAANRIQIETTLVANQFLQVPKSKFLKTLLVPSGFNVADEKIEELTEENDLVITADIPLASKVIEKGALALNPRGMLYSNENIGEILGMRNLMDELRSGGLETGGPAAFNAKDREAFANQLDQILNKQNKNG